MKRPFCCPSACALWLSAVTFAAGHLSAAEWTWTWTPAPGDKIPTTEICTFKYDKTWAYAVEIDDGPRWVRTFAVPFLAEYHYTDAPPGVAGGKRRPFVGSASVIVGVAENNDAALNWDDLKALLEAGWGVMNHSFDHRANGWSGPSVLLSPAQAQEDASCGIGVATRVGGSSPRDVLSPKVNWMDFARSYLDEKVWSNEWNKSQPMADFPGADKGGPATNSLVIDFTHVIDSKPGSANLDRWRTRLKTIEDRWGAGGADTLWCAPTAEVADYRRAAKTAKVSVAPGRLAVSLPDNIPGSALTLRLSGIGVLAAAETPVGGALYRQGETLVLTSPRIGLWGVAPPVPRLKCVYEGPARSVDFGTPCSVAGVTLRVFGNPPSALPYRLAVRTADGERVFAERTVGPGWVVGGHLCPIIPNQPAITGTGIVVSGAEPLKAMTVWVIDDGPPTP